MLGQIELFRNLTDGAKRVDAFVHLQIAHVRTRSAASFCKGPGADDHSSSSAGASKPLIFAFRILEGLKIKTLRGVIGTSTPVLGLRPMRSDFSRTRNRPKDDTLTGCPAESAMAISSRTDSTR